jgi:putative DNA primase/helicase
MSSTKKILDRLSGVKETSSGWSARCPAHEDRQASLSISEGQDGRVLLKCHAGCDHKKIVSALGLEERDLFDQSTSTRPVSATKASSCSRPTPKKAGKAYATADEAQKAYERTLGKSATVHKYLDENGIHVGSVIRWQLSPTSKEIRPTSLHADGWRLEHMPEPRPLLDRRTILETAGPVYVVEGEKAFDAASGLGLVATASAGGANTAGKSDWSPLAGREVVILPDNDDAGRKYAADVAEILHELDPPATVRVVELDGLDEGGDVADLYEACQSEEELKALSRIERA